MTRIRPFFAAALVAVVVAATFATAAAPAGAVAPLSTPIPIGGVDAYSGRTLVDPAVEHAFVAGVRTNDGGVINGGVAETNLDGSNPVLISGIANGQSIALSPDGLTLYVVDMSGFIYAVNAQTLAIVRTYPTAIAHHPTGCPNDVAVAGGDIWFTYYCGENEGGLGEIDPSTGVVTVSGYAGIDRGYLASSPANPNVLVDAESAVSTYTVSVFAVSGSTATLTTTADGISPGHLLTLSPDGADFIGWAANPTTHEREPTEYSVADLTPTGNVYGDGSYTDSFGFAFSYSADGNYVGISRPGVTTYRRDGTVVHPYVSPVGRVQDNEVQALAWVGTSVLALATDIYGGILTLVDLTDAIQTPTEISLSAPTTAPRGQLLNVSGVLSGSPIAGMLLTVTKTSIEGTGTLPSVTTDSSGAFTIRDTPYIGGPVTYSVAYAGDATHGASSTSVTVDVSRATPTLAITTDRSRYAYDTRVYVTAHLGTTNTNRTVTLYITQYRHAKEPLKTGEVDSHGDLTTYFYGTVNTTLEATFSGDPIYAPVTTTANLIVDGSMPTRVTGYYGTSGNYHLYHYSSTALATISATLFPDVYVPGRHVWFTAQEYRSGKWVTAAPSVKVFISNDGAAAGFHGTQYAEFRLQVIFYGDAGNGGVTGPDWYVEFR